METKLKVLKVKTVLIKWNNTKIVIDTPFDMVEKIMNDQTISSMKVMNGHSIKTAAINEWYRLEITDEIEAWIMDEFPTIQDDLMKDVNERKKSGQKVNKEIIGNIIARKYSEKI